MSAIALLDERHPSVNLLIDRPKENGTNLQMFLDCSKAFDFENHNYLMKL